MPPHLAEKGARRLFVHVSRDGCSTSKESVATPVLDTLLGPLPGAN